MALCFSEDSKPSKNQSLRRSKPKTCAAKCLLAHPVNAHISPSYIERQNLTIRMAIRRFTRLTNAFSKKLDNHKVACALHFAYYNFCRIHKSPRVTPAMEAGLTDRIMDAAGIAFNASLGHYLKSTSICWVLLEST